MSLPGNCASQHLVPILVNAELVKDGVRPSPGAATVERMTAADLDEEGILTGQCCLQFTT